MRNPFLLIFIFILVSCSKATKGFVEGYWEMEKGTIDGVVIQGEFRIQFFKDKTGRWGSSYYTMDSIFWDFDKSAQRITINEMKSDSSLKLIITEKQRNQMKCVSDDTNNIELEFNRL